MEKKILCLVIIFASFPVKICDYECQDFRKQNCQKIRLFDNFSQYNKKIAIEKKIIYSTF